MAALSRWALAAALLGATTGASAQGTTHAVVVGAHIQRLDHRDERVSPLMYRGTLGGGSAGYQRARAGELSALDLGFTLGSLAAGDRGGRQWLGIGQVRASHLWRVAPTLLVGADLTADVRVLDHQYRFAADEVFESSAAGLAPAVRWEPRFAPGLHLRVAAPVLSWVRHSYSRVKAGNEGGFALAGPGSWREATLEVNHVLAADRRVGWRLGYRLALRSLARDDGYAAVENRVHLASVVRLGAR